MAHLTRWKRNERIAIAVMIAVIVLYLLLLPVIEPFFPSAPARSLPADNAPASSSGPPTALPRQTRPDRRGP